MSSTTEADLKVTGIDFLKSKNCPQHHTDAYNIKNLVVRRGVPFQLQISFSRELKPSDKLALRFGIGEQPMKNRGTLMSLNPSREPDSSGWKISTAKKSGKECLLSVTSSPSAPVGKYTLNVKTGTNIYKPENSEVYLLFNPWCEALQEASFAKPAGAIAIGQLLAGELPVPGDAVFLDDDAKRKEYVLNDTGTIYVGSANSIYSRPWNFGQFEESILDACMYLLDKSELKLAKRRDPVVVSRAMSALVNANDDNGVLLGNWSGDYSKGTSPMDWIGSVAILQQFYKNKKPVFYGQCWVFAGVLTTVMRCLGIPSRCVTNFNSAHDTDNNLRVDVYLNEYGEKMSSMSFDSVWNFHVWNDVWMKRTDLPAGFDGWQAIDATPQEQSQGIFQCGPCPVKAVREGSVYLLYDGTFVYAEVNADQVYWLVREVNGRQKITRLSSETRAIGVNISTKAVGQDKREDITSEYKFPEGSQKERESMQKAASFIRPATLIPRTHYAAGQVIPASASSEPLQDTVSKTGLQIEITNVEPLYPGSPLELAITVKIAAPGTWAINLVGSCQLQSYTGKIEGNLGYVKETIQLEGQSEKRIPLMIMPDTYMNTLAAVEDEVLVHVTAIAEVQGVDDKLTKEVTKRFDYPPITIQMPERAKLNEDFTCAFIFKNKLNVALDNCKLMVEGLGLFKMTTFDQGDLPSSRIMKSEIICKPTRLGEKKIVAKLSATQVKGISAEKSITIFE